MWDLHNSSKIGVFANELTDSHCCRSVYNLPSLTPAYISDLAGYPCKGAVEARALMKFINIVVRFMWLHLEGFACLELWVFAFGI